MQENLKNNYIEEQRRLYLEKNAYLDSLYEKVTPYEFYREVFPEGSFERKGHYEDGKGNGIAITFKEASKAHSEASGIHENADNEIDSVIIHYTVTDDLKAIGELVKSECAIMSPVSYFGKSRAGVNARYLYAITFDLDGIGMPQLRDTLHQMKTGFLPSATFVVNSGTGLHLYYLLEKPVAMYPQIQKIMNEIKYSLTRRIWNRFTSNIKEPQIQGVLQGFRVVGSGTKLGTDYPVVAYRYGKRVSLKYLMSYIPATNGELQRIEGLLKKMRESDLTLEKAKEKYPDWYERRIVNGEKRGRWTVKRDLYDWWLGKIEHEINVGHRFYGIMTLAIYAMKCGISEEELHLDAYRLMKVFDDLSYEDTNRFTEDDVIKALEMYNENFVTFPRRDIEKYSGIQIPVNKRNWRKQKTHLFYIRGVKRLKQKMGENVSGGRPSKEQLIRDYMIEHPQEKNKSKIAKELNIHRNTVGKYYEAIRRDLDLIDLDDLKNKESKLTMVSAEVTEDLHTEDWNAVF